MSAAVHVFGDCLATSRDEGQLIGSVEIPLNVWGPSTWDSWHMISFAYPPGADEGQEVPADKREEYANYYETGSKVLPCSDCSARGVDYMARNPIRDCLHARSSLVKYVVDMHNDVNSRTGKKIMSVAEVCQGYQRRINNPHIHGMGLRRNPAIPIVLSAALFLLVLILLAFAISRRVQR